MARPSTKRPGTKFISPDSLRKVGLVQFFQETIGELRKSVWPTREETTRLTWIVILLSALAAFAFAGLDFTLGRTLGNYIIHP